MEILDITNNLLGDLRLHGITETISTRLREANSGNLGNEEFLNLILQDEKQFRDNAKIKRLTKRATFKQSASLEALDYTQKRGLDKHLISNLGTGRFVSEGTNIIISGPTGAGKSYLATAIGSK